MVANNCTSLDDDDDGGDDDEESYYGVSIVYGNFSIIDKLLAGMPNDTLVKLSLGDDETQLLELPFNFPYFAQCYADGVVSSNGLFMMGEAYDGQPFSQVGGPMTDNEDPTSAIAMLWSDLNPASAGNIYYASLSGKVHNTPVRHLSIHI